MARDKFQASRKRAELRKRAIEYKGGCCQICGYNRCNASMDFHHVDPREKSFSVSQRMTSFEAIRAELDKTVLLCANCHREVHDGLHPNFICHEGTDRSGYDWGGEDD